MDTEVSVVRRYTDLPSAIAILRSKCITLLDPSGWEDKPDAGFIAVYKERRALKVVKALCFSEASETFHHWRIFSHGPAGVCVSFRKGALLERVATNSGLTARSVDYRKLNALDAHRAAVDDLPFVKRHPFRDEKEFRIVYSSTRSASKPVSLLIGIACVERVTISPWIDKVRFRHLKEKLQSLPGCGRLKIVRSTLMDNEKWIQFGARAE